MRLIACAAPDVSLIRAPVSALCGLEGAGQWEAFWAVGSDAYFARRQDATGTGSWYQLVDTPPELAAPQGPDALTPVRRDGTIAATTRRAGALRLRRTPRSSRAVLTATVHARAKRSL